MEKFKVVCDGIKDGKFADRYGKRGERNRFGMALVSPPLKFFNPPEGTVCYALLMEDKDAFPVCGFSYIHWTAVNIKRTEIEEDGSRNAEFIQGVNSWFRNHPANECACYGGMAPPDAPHLYEIHVYALDAELELKNGFLFNDMFKKMDGHILATATVKGYYDN